MPSIDKVIEVYEKINITDVQLAIIAEILWVILAIVFIVYLIKDRKTFSLKGLIFRGFFLVINLAIINYLFFSIKEYDFSMNKKKWEKQYLKPYLNSLPEQKKYVEDFSQLLTNKVSGIKSVYLNNKEKPIWVELYTNNKNGLVKKTHLQAFIQKEHIKNPFLTYKTIEKTISENYTDDLYYETVLHIPWKYKVIIPTK